MLRTVLIVIVLAFLQSVSNSLSSRSRNRNNFRYHTVAAIFSNGVWFCSFKVLADAGMNWVLILPYTLGTVCGSLSGAKIGMIIERWLGAACDSHLHNHAPKLGTDNKI